MPTVRWHVPSTTRMGPDRRLPLLRAAVAAAPHDTLLALRLARTMVTAGALEEARDLAAGLARRPLSTPEEHLGLSTLQWAVGDAAAALSTLDEAPARYHDQPELRLARARLQQHVGLSQAAERGFRTLLQHEALLREATHGLVALLTAQERVEETLPILDLALQAGVADARLLSWKVTALEAVERTSEMQALLAYEALLRPAPLWKDADLAQTVNAALEALVEESLPLRYAGEDQASRNSWRFNGLHKVDAPAARRLHEALRTAVAGYAASLAARSRLQDHPFVSRFPTDLRLVSWTLLCRAQGYERPHIHSKAWLSGVYYVAVPSTVRADDATHAGWLGFGVDPRVADPASAAPRRLLRPEPGLCVLFPSYYYHHTIPTSSDEARICVAFDVEPVRR